MARANRRARAQRTITASAAQNNTAQSVRGNVRANYYRVMNVTSQTVDRFFGPVDATTLRQTT